jgi:hypothetical protein
MPVRYCRILLRWELASRAKQFGLTGVAAKPKTARCTSLTRPKCQDFLDRVFDTGNGFVARNQDIMLQALHRHAEPELVPA